MILVEGASMRLSKRSEYGLKAAVRLATHQGFGSSGGGYLQSREIADAERMPPKFLESVLLSLRSAQILVSKVGAGGGYRLSRAPELIRVHEVIDALERENPEASGEEMPEDAAGHRALGVLHRRLDDAVAGALGTLTLGELVEMCGSESGAGRG